MSVPDSEYDLLAPAMLADTVTAQGCEFVRTPGSFVLLPVVLLPDRTGWVTELPMNEIARMQADWRFLTTAEPDHTRPALVRLDLRFPSGERLAFVWTIAIAPDLSALSFACLADAVAFRHRPDADLGISVQNLDLRDLDGFREIATRTRAAVVLEALHD